MKRDWIDCTQDTNVTAKGLPKKPKRDPIVPVFYGNKEICDYLSKKIHRIIVEVKAVKTLKPGHIRKTIRKYKYPYFPDRYD